MPKGVHGNHTRNGGGKPSCLCGDCFICRKREINRAYRQRHGIGRFVERRPEIIRETKPQISDAELERRLVDKFRKMGWD